MKHHNLIEGCIAATVLLATGCSKPVNSNPDFLDSDLPGSMPAKLFMGQAYDAPHARIYNRSCVTGKIVQMPGSQTELKYKKDMSFDEMVKNLTGKLDIGVDFPIVSAGAGIEYAKQNSSTELSETHTVYWTLNRRSDKLDPATLQLTADGQQYADHERDKIYAKCGDEFINQIDYGATLMVTLKFEFANNDDKQSFGGNLKVDLNLGVAAVNISGELKKLDSELKKRVTVTLDANQIGGDPNRLAHILEGSLAFCDLNNIDACLRTMASTIEYAKNDFSTQLEDPTKYNVVHYLTTSYANSQKPADRLIPGTIVPVVDELVRARRKVLNDQFETEKQNYERSSVVLTNYSAYLSENQKTAVLSIQNASLKNASTYANAIQFCFDHPDTTCTDKKLDIVSYDAGQLELNLPQTYSDDAICTMERDYLLNKAIISRDDYNYAKGSNSGPVYKSEGVRDDAIDVWAACALAAPELRVFYKK